MNALVAKVVFGVAKDEPTTRGANLIVAEAAPQRLPTEVGDAADDPTRSTVWLEEDRGGVGRGDGPGGELSAEEAQLRLTISGLSVDKFKRGLARRRRRAIAREEAAPGAAAAKPLYEATHSESRATVSVVLLPKATLVSAVKVLTSGPR